MSDDGRHDGGWGPVDSYGNSEMFGGTRNPSYTGSPVHSSSSSGFNGGCFAGSTKILTPKGEVRIDALTVKQIILSWNQASRELVEQPVQKIITHRPSTIFELYYQGRASSVLLTQSHTLLTQDGWKTVGKLRSGDALLVHTGAGAILAPITHLIRTHEKQPVYNLRTKGEHNFIADNIVSHNFTHFRQLRTFWYQTADMISDAVQQHKFLQNNKPTVARPLVKQSLRPALSRS